MAITAVLSLNEEKARRLSAGTVKVFLAERVPGRGPVGHGESSLPHDASHQKHKSKQDTSMINHERCVTLVSDDEIEEPIADAGEYNTHHEQVMLLMLQQLNNAFRERLAGVKRAVFNTVVQRSLAKNAPRTMEELEKMTVSGVSVTMKKKYGKYLVQSVAQVDAFIDRHANRLDTMIDSFELDVDAILGPRIMTANDIHHTQMTPAKIGGLDWGDSDDDWEIMPSENPNLEDISTLPGSYQDGSWNHVSRSNNP